MNRARPMAARLISYWFFHDAKSKYSNGVTHENTLNFSVMVLKPKTSMVTPIVY